MLRVLIVDDEAPARRYLRRLLEATPGIKVDGEAATLVQARHLIHHCSPDAIFLDVALACGSGFDLLGDLSPAPAVVFVTAHADYAARAFDVQAVDYLLKPVGPERLAQTVARLMPYSGLDLRTSRGKRFIKPQDVSLVQAQGDYVMLHSSSHGKELIHTTLKTFTEQLPSPPFCTLSRSVVINLDHVAHVATQPGEGTQVAFVNGLEPVTLGRTATQRLRQALAVPRKPAPALVQNGTAIFSEMP